LDQTLQGQKGPLPSTQPVPGQHSLHAQAPPNPRLLSSLNFRLPNSKTHPTLLSHHFTE